jgi:hypothetical protein
MTAPSNPAPQPRDVDPNLTRLIRQASEASGSDFGLLMAQAAQESGFKPDAKSSTSSATGLFQFIDSTWLDMVHRFGGKYGVGALAQKIGTDPQGKPHVADAATRHRILALRKDPSLSAALAGEYAKLNKAEVERAVGHKVGRAELYMAHFLGAGGASHLLKALEKNGATPAARLLPDAAASNRSVFFEGETGRARSVAEIYRALGSRIEREARNFAGADTAAPTPSASAGTSTPTPTVAQARPHDLGAREMTPPVASILDTLTLAALKLTGNAPAHPRRTEDQG